MREIFDILSRGTFFPSNSFVFSPSAQSAFLLVVLEHGTLVGFTKGARFSGTRWTQAGLSQTFTSRKALPKYTQADQRTVSICVNPCLKKISVSSVTSVAIISLSAFGETSPAAMRRGGWLNPCNLCNPWLKFASCVFAPSMKPGLSRAKFV